jgi:hypothetical protein
LKLNSEYEKARSWIEKGIYLNHLLYHSLILTSISLSLFLSVTKEMDNIKSKKEIQVAKDISIENELEEVNKSLTNYTI